MGLTGIGLIVVVVLPDPFREMGAWKNSTDTQQSGHVPRSGPGVGLIALYVTYAP